MKIYREKKNNIRWKFICRGGNDEMVNIWLKINDCFDLFS